MLNSEAEKKNCPLYTIAWAMQNNNDPGSEPTCQADKCMMWHPLYGKDSGQGECGLAPRELNVNTRVVGHTQGD